MTDSIKISMLLSQQTTNWAAFLLVTFIQDFRGPKLFWTNHEQLALELQLIMKAAGLSHKESRQTISC
jgi:hypothetical protein